MAFIEKGQEIDIEAIKAETQLSAEALRLKERRDRELADIISGEDDRILLVIGPCSSDNEEAVLEYARRLSACRRRWRTRFSWLCVFILLNLAPTETAIKVWSPTRYL